MKQCEHIDYPEDGGNRRCTRKDTSWYEFWRTGTAGCYCASHWPYQDDMAALKRARERTAKREQSDLN